MQRKILMIVGLALIVFGFYCQVNDTGVSAADQARCEQIVKSQSGGSQEALYALLPKCADPGMVAMMDAQATGADAQSTGQSIAAANQQDVSSHLFDWIIIGIGIAALLGSVIIGRRPK